MPSPLIRALGLAAPRPHIEGCLHDNENSHDRAVDGQLNLLPDCQLLFWHRLKCERGGIHLLEAPMPRW
jgi:hypothetical protein